MRLAHRRPLACSLLRASLAILASACASLRPPPPCSVENEWGVAHASTPAAAERLSEHVAWLAPRIVERVPGLSNRQVDARFVDDMELEGLSAGLAPWVKGTTISKGSARWIELPEGANGAAEKGALAHELVHFWIGSEWETLPYFLEEGLAENVRDSVVPAGWARESQKRELILSTVVFGGLILDEHGRVIRCGSASELTEPGAGKSCETVLFSCDRRTLPDVRETLAVHGDALKSVRDPEKYTVMFCFGYLLVGRIGIERLHALCLRARAAGHRLVPADWVLEAAGLPLDDREAWNRAILELGGRRLAP